jgi:hypothetical protein
MRTITTYLVLTGTATTQTTSAALTEKHQLSAVYTFSSPEKPTVVFWVKDE